MSGVKRIIFDIATLFNDISQCRELCTNEDIEEVIKFSYLKYLQKPEVQKKYGIISATYADIDLIDPSFWDIVPIYRHEEQVSEYVLEHFGYTIQGHLEYFLSTINTSTLTIINIEVLESLLIIETV